MQISGHRTSLIFFLMALWLGAGFPATRAQSWNEDSFEDFADGRLDASGQNLYVSRNGTVRTVHRFDLNQDGYLDLIFNNTHDSITYVDATWAGFDAARTLTHSTLAVLGSLGAVAGDLNRDGFTDLVFCPNPDGIQHPRRFISIAWGAAEGWSSNRISGVLPAWDPRAVAIADLNRDGWPDIVVLAQAPRRQPGGKPVESMVMKVFWGSRLGFYLGRRQIHELPVSVDLKAADFDADGARDVAVLTAENEIRVFWASSEPSTVARGPELHSASLSLALRPAAWRPGISMGTDSPTWWREPPTRSSSPSTPAPTETGAIRSGGKPRRLPTSPSAIWTAMDTPTWR